ncbi:MAG TPA: CvpA family protein [Steroidobacteraceae bacterium]|nr:CvpA family protein [Steroidobacteraceae bacterium]
MTGIDILLVSIVLVSAIIGLVRGLIREIISLVVWIAGLWCAWRFAYLIEPELGGVLSERPVSLWVARGLILVGILVLGGIANGVVGYFIRHSALSWLDRGLGVFFGLLRGLVLVGVVSILGHVLKLTDGPSWRDSQLGAFADSTGAMVKSLVDDAGQSLKSPGS